MVIFHNQSKRCNVVKRILNQKEENEIRPYSVAELRQMPSLGDGDLKISTPNFRVWLKNDSVLYMKLFEGRWVFCDGNGDLI